MGNENTFEPQDIETWATQIAYWRSHLDVFIMDVLGIKLFPHQRVITRVCGNRNKMMFVASRGASKSWLSAIIAISLAILYPRCPIAVCSATAQQATIVLKKVRDFVNLSPVIAAQIKMVGREPVIINKDKGKCEFLNGSTIESFSTSSIVGERTKVIIADENYRILEEVYKKNVLPCNNYTRDICLQNGYDDFDSKVIQITSCSLKSSYFYSDFCNTYEAMKNGDDKVFAVSLGYMAAVHMGITKLDYFEERRKELPEPIFATEYESIFLGEEANSVFPYELTSSSRKIKRVEYAMPKGGKAWYIMALDIATSSAKNSDNAVITVIKCTDRDDGSILKQVVYIRSYNGHKLDDLADELRRTYVRFPNIVKIVYDARGLGDSLPEFLNTPWVDPETDKEYPPWCVEGSISHNAEPMLYAFRANLGLNQELVSALRVCLEQKTLTLPVDSHAVDVFNEDANSPLRKEEKAIYIETDALQVEMGNLVMKTSGSTGNVTYDVAKANQHKDRYSSLAMGVWYIYQKEMENKKAIASRARGAACIGVVSYL